MSPATASRRRVLRRLLSTAEVRSQAQLVDLLDDAGHRVTQATISRDLDAIGAVKDRAAGGHYTIPENGTDANDDVRELTRAVNDFVLSIVPSDNLIVVKTHPGAAHLVAGAIDRTVVNGVLGTVAGDDTLLVVAAADLGGDRLAETLERIGAQR